MNHTKRAFTAATLAALLTTAVAPLAASATEAWPPRQITFVVALGPGGSADRTARPRAAPVGRA
jgi:tripartite-type tricarboxylate transporter receptor subunit TctC